MIRGVAAAAVVLSHISSHLEKSSVHSLIATFLLPGHAGVDLFFVVSGFVIFFRHNSDIGKSDRIVPYFLSRFIRIFPLYWIATALTFLISAFVQSRPSTTLHLFWSLTLFPTFFEPILNVAWTLQYEFIFYAIFSALIFNINLGALVMLVWFAGILGNLLGAFPVGFPASLIGFYSIEFLLGCFSAAIFQKQKFSRPFLIFIVGVISFFAALMLEIFGILDGYDNWARLFYGVPAAMTICGLSAAEKYGRIKIPHSLVFVGKCSYSIYLFHIFFISFAWKCIHYLDIENIISPLLIYILLFSFAMTGGIFVSWAIEFPMHRIIRKTIDSYKVR